MRATKDVGAALRGAGYLVGLQAVSRALTFVLNLAVARRVAPGIYGLAALSLATLYSVVLTISREAVRRAARRTNVAASGAVGLQRIANLGWLAALLSCLCAPVGCALVLWAAPSDASFRESGVLGGRPSYALAVLAFGSAAILESLAEPAYVLAENLLLVRARVRVEAAALLAKCLLTAGLVLLLDVGLGAFAAAQLAHSGAILLGWAVALWGDAGLRAPIAAARRSESAAPGQAATAPAAPVRLEVVRALLPRRYLDKSGTAGWIDGEASADFGRYMLFELVKLAVAEGEKVAMVGLGVSATTQGEYGLVTNLGSLVVRLIFLPVEEVSSTLFSRLAAAGDQAALAETLGLMLKIVSTVGLLILAFGPVYAFSAIHVLYSGRWSLETEAPRVLAWYCLYVLLLALNGTLEGFLQAAADARQQARYNAALCGFAAAHVAAATAAAQLGLGSVGLVLAGCVSMALRIAYAGAFARRLLGARFGPLLAHVLPGHPFAGAVAGAAAGTAALGALGGVLWAPAGGAAGRGVATVRLPALAAHVGLGAVAFAAVLLVFWMRERPFIQRVQAAVAQGRHAD